MPWENKMSTHRWAEVCKMFQNPSAAETKANIHHVRTMLVFRKLSSTITGELTQPEHTLPLFLNQINLVLLQSQSLTWCLHPSSSQFLVCGQIQISVQGRPSAESCECQEWWENREMGVHHCPVQTQSRGAQQGSPCDLSAQISPTEARGAGWWQQLLQWDTEQKAGAKGSQVEGAGTVCGGNSTTLHHHSCSAWPGQGVSQWKGKRGTLEEGWRDLKPRQTFSKAGQSGRCLSGNSSCLHLLSCAVAVTNISPPTSPA